MSRETAASGPVPGAGCQTDPGRSEVANESTWRWSVSTSRSAPAGGPLWPLLGIWSLVGLVLSAWGVLIEPGSAPVPVHTREAPLPPETPRDALISLWLHWDTPDGTGGWVVLEPGERLPPAAELYQRRRLHPGWNQLAWDDVAGFAADRSLTVRIAEGQPRTWGLEQVRASAHPGLAELRLFRGFLMTLLLGAMLGTGALVRWVGEAGWRRIRISPWHGALLGIGLAALWLRLHRLTSQSFWFDEVLTAIGSQSLAWVLHSPQIFAHPPLQYLVGWMAGGGADEGWLRTPFVFAGVATVIAIAQLGRRLGGAPTGILAALLLALSPFHVELSQLARPYAFLLLFSVLSMLALVHALEDRRWPSWLGFSVVAAINLYTHYFGLQVLLVQLLVAVTWLVRGRGRDAGLALVSFAGIGVLFLPWTGVIVRLASSHLGGAELSWTMLTDLAARVLVPQYLGPGRWGVIALVLAAAGLLAWQRRPHVAVTLLLWILVPLGVLWLAQPTHFVAGRHLAVMMPAAILLVAHGVASLATGGAVALARAVPDRPTLRRGGAVLGASVFLLVWSVPSATGLHAYYRSRLGVDWRAVASVLNRVIEPGDRVVAALGAAYPLRHYWRHDVLEVDHASLPTAARSRLTDQRLWIVTADGWEREPAFHDWLTAHAIQVGEVPPSWSLPGLRIHRAR